MDRTVYRQNSLTYKPSAKMPLGSYLLEIIGLQDPQAASRGKEYIVKEVGYLSQHGLEVSAKTKADSAEQHEPTSGLWDLFQEEVTRSQTSQSRFSLC